MSVSGSLTTPVTEVGCWNSYSCREKHSVDISIAGTVELKLDLWLVREHVLNIVEEGGGL